MKLSEVLAEAREARRIAREQRLQRINAQREMWHTHARRTLEALMDRLDLEYDPSQVTIDDDDAARITIDELEFRGLHVGYAFARRAGTNDAWLRIRNADDLLIVMDGVMDAAHTSD